MQAMIDELAKQAAESLGQVSSKETLASFWQEYLSKNGKIPALMKNLRSVAPEERPAMGKIINELEDNKRGIYGGAIGYISFTGNLDTCIAIRLAFSKNGKVFVRSGAGIVADSVPEKEYRECIQKAAAVRQALQKAQEGMEA